MLRPSAMCAAAAALTAGLGLSATPATAQRLDDARQQLERIERQIESGKATQRRREQEAADVSARLRALQRKLVAAAGETQGLEQATIEAEARLNEMSGRVYQHRAALESREIELSQTLATMVRIRRQPAVVALADAGSAIDSLRASRLLAAATGLMAGEADEMREAITDLAALHRDIADEQRRLERLSGELDGSRRRLARLVDEMRERQAALRSEQRQTSRELTVLAGKARNVRDLIERLEDVSRREAQARAAREREAQAEREAAARRAAAERQSREQTRTAMITAPPAARLRREAAPISAARGRLAMPVRGRILRNFGQTGETGLREKGVTLIAGEDAQVIAPYDGAVAFAGPFRDYGLVLIISHGEGYHTLLAGLARAYVETGQQVLAGEPVGQMGRGGDKQRSLYVELRRGGEAIDPRSWWQSGRRKVTG